MINLFLLLLTAWGYYSGEFWTMIFCTIFIVRYKFNKNTPILLFSVISTMTITLFSHTDLSFFGKEFFLIFSLQVIAALWSQIYSLYHRLWRKDIVFLIMEPVLIVYICSYLIHGGFDPTISLKLNKWLSVYIAIQSVTVLAKTVYAFNKSLDAATFLLKMKLLFKNLNQIDSSFGLYDFSFLQASKICHPTVEEIVVKEFNFCSNKISSIIQNKDHNFRKIDNEQKDYEIRFIKDKKEINKIN